PTASTVRPNPPALTAQLPPDPAQPPLSDPGRHQPGQRRGGDQSGPPGRPRPAGQPHQQPGGHPGQHQREHRGGQRRPRGSSGSAGTTSTTHRGAVGATPGEGSPVGGEEAAAGAPVVAACWSSWATSGLAAEAVSTVVPSGAMTMAP